MRALPLALVALVVGCGAGDPPSVAVSITPSSALVDRPVAIAVTGAQPGAAVTLVATTTDEFGDTWGSRAVFTADAQGRVDVTRDASRGGTYRGRDAMGLFWSMRDLDSNLSRTRQWLIPDTGSTVQVQAEIGGSAAATATLTRRLRDDDVTLRRTTVEHDGFPGCFWQPAHVTRPMPAILEFGGSEGGLDCGEGLLASHGYPELGIAYFGYPGLPRNLDHIPIEYFARALRWLAQQPGVDPSRLVVSGVSRGGEAALLTASSFPGLAYSAVAFVGSNFAGYSVLSSIDPAWTLGGTGIPWGFQIPAWKIRGPVFAVGALEDRLFNSGNNMLNLARAMRAHHDTRLTALVYPNAGHAIGSPVPNLAYGDQVLDFGVPEPWGGTIAGDAHARADAWPKLLAFLAGLRR